MVNSWSMGHLLVRLRVRYRGAPAVLVDEREAAPSHGTFAGEAFSSPTTCPLAAVATRHRSACATTFNRPRGRDGRSGFESDLILDLSVACVHLATSEFVDVADGVANGIPTSYARVSVEGPT